MTSGMLRNSDMLSKCLFLIFLQIVNNMFVFFFVLCLTAFKSNFSLTFLHRKPFVFTEINAVYINTFNEITKCNLKSIFTLFDRFLLKFFFFM